jgi:hypothetical protein
LARLDLAAVPAPTVADRKENPRQGFDIAHFAEGKEGLVALFLGALPTIFGKEERVLPARSAFFARKRAFSQGAISVCARPITRAAPRGN